MMIMNCGKRKILYYTERLKQENHHSIPMMITMVYGVIGILWILLSDKLLKVITNDPVIYRQLQTYKGWLYVLITMILLYTLIKKRVKLMESATNETIEAYIQLRETHQELISMKKELEYQRRFTQKIIDDAPVIIGIWDKDGKIENLNPFGQTTFGYKEAELTNKKWFNLLLSQENKLKMHNAFEKISQGREFKNYESQFISKDGRSIDILWNSTMLNYDDGSNKVISVGIDITERKKYEESFRYIAFYDSLTGLINRIMFENEISKLISSKSEKNKFAVTYIDIDNFKYINDTLGHRVGDEFLKHVGMHLNVEIKAPNLVARLGGDEFAIVFMDIESDQILIEKIEKIKKGIGRTWSSNNHQFFVSMSIGVVMFPDHGNNTIELLKSADIAMYAAKQGGKDRVVFYKEDMEKNNLEHVQMANKLQFGIENEEFTLFYQPQFRLNTGEIIGMEALVRWIHPIEGFIAPIDFIPLAEETGQIYSLERWIVKKALQQKQQWEKTGFGHIELSINLSGKTVASDVDFHQLEMLVTTFDVDYSKIIIEITETAIISNIELVIERLNRLKNKGFKIALDDFGTGYSSLTYLKKLPIDIIKLDKSFINLIPQNNIDTLIIKHILSLAHDLKYEVVAEGIETKEQLEYLKKYYCKSGQGYLLSKPLSHEETSDLLDRLF
ncbi:PAS domain S-box/diguanylate cyclase (GGDEF) domain [Clostridium aceticum]|uniref:PAS domain S-box/diguanylate cyclase (GGDEF) domain n=2 Tax=Clostridium aceticum TaxID=84022 RepID=A0A0G3WE18_9CLOT|nr:PAS domain S-box/diguanylate cyclase (GGDEF) domain [Clostridium aceticum]